MLNSYSYCIVLSLLAAGVVLSATPADAAVSPAQRKELLQIRRDVSKVRVLLRRKMTDEAAQIIEAAQKQLDELIDGGVDKKDRIVESLQKLIESSRSDLAEQTGMPEEPRDSKQRTEVDIPRPTGDETVSFTRDIAPFVANICLRCHSGDNPRSGFSVETFEKLMIGGDSGQVVLPGDLEGSRLWDLVGKQKPIKMPPGANLLITRKNHGDLRKWIEEGAKFDGKDPQAALRDIVPSAEDEKAAELAAMSSEEFSAFRVERSREQWHKVLPKEEPLVEQGREVVALGNVSAGRLKQVVTWADEQAGRLRELFDGDSSQLWKGRLTLFVFKDRYGYDEFNLVIERRRVPRELIAHSNVATTFEDAYVVFEDVGDRSTETAPSLRCSVIDHVTSSFLKRGGENLPTWLVRGTGLALAAERDDKVNPYYRSLRGSVDAQLKTVSEPAQVFDDDTFSPAAVEAVGLTLVEFLRESGNQERFQQFIAALQKGKDMHAGLEAAYRTRPELIGRAFLATQR